MSHRVGEDDAIHIKEDYHVIFNHDERLLGVGKLQLPKERRST
jgi:hypothetical protein